MWDWQGGLVGEGAACCTGPTTWVQPWNSQRKKRTDPTLVLWLPHTLGLPSPHKRHTHTHEIIWTCLFEKKKQIFSGKKKKAGAACAELYINTFLKYFITFYWVHLFNSVVLSFYPHEMVKKNTAKPFQFMNMDLWLLFHFCFCRVSVLNINFVLKKNNCPYFGQYWEIQLYRVFWDRIGDVEAGLKHLSASAPQVGNYRQVPR